MNCCFFSVTLVVSVSVIFSFGRGLTGFARCRTPTGTVVFSCCTGFVPCFTGLFDTLFIFITIVLFASGLTNGSRVVTVLTSNISFGQLLHPCLVAYVVLSTLDCMLSTCIVPRNAMMHRGFRAVCGGGGGGASTRGMRLRMSGNIVTCVRRCSGGSGQNCKFYLSGFRSGGLMDRLATVRVRCSAVSSDGCR